MSRPTGASSSSGCAGTSRASRWARLLKRVFAIDVLVRELCGGKRRVIAFLTEPRIVQKILAHLGLLTEPPPVMPARPPPDPALAFA